MNKSVIAIVHAYLPLLLLSADDAVHDEYSHYGFAALDETNRKLSQRPFKLLRQPHTEM